MSWANAWWRCLTSTGSYAGQNASAAAVPAAAAAAIARKVGPSPIVAPEPPGGRIGDEPTGVRERELGGEDGGQTVGQNQPWLPVKAAWMVPSSEETARPFS